MFKEFGWLSDSALTYRALNNLTQECISNLLKSESEIHSLNRRSMEPCMNQNHVQHYTMNQFLVQRLGYEMFFFRLLEMLVSKLLLRKGLKLILNLHSFKTL